MQLKNRADSFRFDEKHRAFARHLRRRIAAFNPYASKLHLAREDDWANELRLAEEVDEIDLALMASVVDWAAEDSFWRFRIQSPRSIRRNWSTLVSKLDSDLLILANH